MKSWISSKTLWFNAIAAVVSVLMDSVGTAPIDPQWQVVVVAAGNFILRLVTAVPVSLSGDS